MSKLLSVDTIYSAFGDPGRIYPYPAKVDIKVTTQPGSFDNIIVNDLDVSQIMKPRFMTGSVPSVFTDSYDFYVYAEPVFNLSNNPTLDLDEYRVNSTFSGFDIMFAFFNPDETYTLSDHQYVLTIESVPEEIELTEGFSHKDLVGGDDRLITVDHYTGLEWFKLSETDGMSIQEVENDARFSGWRVANNYEAITFMNNIIRFVDSSATLFDSANGAPAVSRSYSTPIDNALIEYLGGPAYGWWYEYSYNQRNNETDGFGGGGYWSNGSVFDWRYDQDKDFSRSGTGVMLVRNGTRPNYIVQTPLYPKEDTFSDAQYSTHNGLTWLKLYHTINMSMQEFLDSDDLKFQGHRLATQSEVQALMSLFAEEQADEAGTSPTGAFPDANRTQWIRDFGRTYPAGGSYYSYGIYDDGSGNIRMAGINEDSALYYYNYPRTGNLTYKSAYEGLFIIKE